MWQYRIPRPGPCSSCGGGRAGKGGGGEATKIRTAFTDPVGCTLPVQLAAMGGMGTAELAAAVAGAGVAELMRRGAGGARVGTLFLATPECGTHPAYLRRLLEATSGDTVITTHYDAGWPDAPHRVLRAPLEEAEKSGWRKTTTPSRSSPDERVEEMAMYAGTGVGHVAEVKAASEVVADLCRDL